jgi:hypothetical protein
MTGVTRVSLATSEKPKDDALNISGAEQLIDDCRASYRIPRFQIVVLFAPLPGMPPVPLRAPPALRAQPRLPARAGRAPGSRSPTLLGREVRSDRP